MEIVIVAMLSDWLGSFSQMVRNTALILLFSNGYPPREGREASSRAHIARVAYTRLDVCISVLLGHMT